MPRQKNTMDIVKIVCDVEYKIPQISVFSLELKQVVCSVWSEAKRRIDASL